MTLYEAEKLRPGDTVEAVRTGELYEVAGVTLYQALGGPTVEAHIHLLGYNRKDGQPADFRAEDFNFYLHAEPQEGLTHAMTKRKAEARWST